jgi:hypothetical protein
LKVAAVGVALALCVSLMLRTGISGRRGLDMLSGLPRNGVVGYEIGGHQIGGHWFVTSGSLLMRRGSLLSGPPDSHRPDPRHGITGSAVLRAVSTEQSFADVRLTVRLNVAELGSTPRTPAQNWDGVHLFLHYRDPYNLYSVDLHRRDGQVTIKRKTNAPAAMALSAAPPSDGGVYETLRSVRLPQRVGWHTYVASIRNLRANGVRIALSVDGRRALSAVDRSPFQILGPGRIGVRGDNAEFSISSFLVESYGAG